MIHAGILILGSEVLSGRTPDRNASLIARELSRIGIHVSGHVTANDRVPEILSALRFLSESSDVLILTGGLGPTFDDVTRKAVGEFAGLPLAFNPSEYARVRARYAAHRRLTGGLKEENRFPKGAVIFQNNYGMASGFGVRFSGRWIIALPGVPAEAEGILRDEVIPFLEKQWGNRGSIEIVHAKITGLGEMEVVRKLGRKFPPEDPSVSCGIYPSGGEVLLEIKVTAENRRIAKETAGRWKAFVARKLGKFLAGFTDQPLERLLVERLRKRKEKISTCESLTGGLIAKRLTDIPGASRVFKGSVVAYCDFAKRENAGVPPKVLKRHGAVSRETARWMARSVSERFHTEWGISTTGVAGPEKEASGAPVGTVFISVAGPRRCRVKKFMFTGDRNKIRWRTSQAAFALLWSILRDEYR